MFQSNSQVISWHLLSLLFCFAHFENIKKKAGRKAGGLAGGGSWAARWSRPRLGGHQVRRTTRDQDRVGSEAARVRIGGSAVMWRRVWRLGSVCPVGQRAFQQCTNRDSTSCRQKMNMTTSEASLPTWLMHKVAELRLWNVSCGTQAVSQQMQQIHICCIWLQQIWTKQIDIWSIKIDVYWTKRLTWGANHSPEIESLTEAIEPQSLRFYLSISISNISIYTKDQDLSISLCVLFCCFFNNTFSQQGTKLGFLSF